MWAGGIICMAVSIGLAELGGALATPAGADPLRPGAGMLLAAGFGSAGLIGISWGAVPVDMGSCGAILTICGIIGGGAPMTGAVTDGEGPSQEPLGTGFSQALSENATSVQWLIRREAENDNGRAIYHSTDDAAALANPDLAPTLTFEF